MLIKGKVVARGVDEVAIPKLIMQLYAMRMTGHLKNFLLATH